MGGPPAPLPYIDVIAEVARNTGDPRHDATMFQWLSVLRDHYQETIGHADVIQTTRPEGPTWDGDAAGSPANPLPEAEARELFNELAALEYIPWNYPEDGSQARAHATVQFLEERGITCNKAWTFGFNPWTIHLPTGNPGETAAPAGASHVAPYLCVRGTDGSLQVLVFDPTVAREPVRVERWQEAQGAFAGESRMVTTDSRYYSYEPAHRQAPNDDSGTVRMDPDFEVTRSALNFFRAQRDLMQAEMPPADDDDDIDLDDEGE